MGYRYTGIDIREEQVLENRRQADEILDSEIKPTWIVGDSAKALNAIDEESFDMVFTCPPYANLEVYSDLEGDISNMDYEDFRVAYRKIIMKSCDKLKNGGFAVVVIGEVRDKYGDYMGLVPETIDDFRLGGLHYYNEAILVTPVASASMRANGNMKTRKLVKTHQNILVFRK